MYKDNFQKVKIFYCKNQNDKLQNEVKIKMVKNLGIFLYAQIMGPILQ